MSIPNLTYYGHTLITAPQIDMDLLWGLSAIFVGLALIYFVSVFFLRNKILSGSTKVKQRKTELSPMISEFLFYEDDETDKNEKSNYIGLKIEIRELLKDDFNRRVLSEILLDLRKDVSGDTQKRLFKLYQDLGLEKDAFGKLKSWRWEIISKGILELTRMQVEEAYTFIIKFINDKRSTIRKQAEIATVTLKPEGINHFLDTTRYKISEWQQLKLLDVIRNQEDFDPPRFKVWLTSTNKHVVLFALRLIKYYNQNDANASLIELVKHKNNQIKEEAIGCIKEFYIVEALPTLKTVFWKCSVDIKIALLDAIAELGKDSDIEFLRTVAQNEGNFSVKSKALGGINTIAPGTIMPTEGIEHYRAYSETLPEVKEDLGAEEMSSTEEFVETLPNIDTVVSEQVLHIDGNEEQNTTEEEPLVETDIETLLDVNYTVEDQVIEKDQFDDNCTDIAITEIPVTYSIVETVADPDSKVLDTILEETTEKPEKNKKDADGPVKVVNDGVNVPDLNEPVSETNNETKPSIGFIPIVVANEIPNVQPTEKYRPMANVKNSDKDLRSIEIDFEEVNGDPIAEKEDTRTSDFDISDIDFLPIVVLDETETVKTELPSGQKNGTADVSPMDMEVFYEEVSQLPIDSDLLGLIEEIKELDFLPVVVDEEIAPETECENKETQNNTDGPLDVDGYILSDFEVVFEEIAMTAIANEEEKVGFNLEDSPIIDVEGPEVDDVVSRLLAENELRGLDIRYETVAPKETPSEHIPEPVYYDEHEAYMMDLLDDLEELGDHREIPLLEELRAAEDKTFIKDRITGLIERFAFERDGRTMVKKNFEQEDELPAYCVFADLFKNIDTESKLILLEEVVAVGDKKELDFLDGLLEDPEPKIRKKAQTVLKLLMAKIANQKAVAIDNIREEKVISTNDTSAYDVAPKPDVNDFAEGSYDNLLSELEIAPALKPEIFEIDFELSEVLDKNYSKKILNIPVLATEVSPNERGSSFLFQLRNFPKNIINKLNG